MTKLYSIRDSVAGRAEMFGGAAFGAAGITGLIHSQRHAGDRVIGLAGHLVLSFFLIALISIAPSLIALARRARPGIAQKAGPVAAAGTALLGVTTITSVVNGRDLGLFTVIAPLTNAAWLFGSVIIAVSLKRAGTVPTAIAVGLPLTWVATVPLSTFGGSLLAGAYFLASGHLLANDAIERRPDRIVAQAPA
jgi:hypothetical protein